MPILVWFTIFLMDNPADVLMNFAGLVVLVEIDNWAGMVFELYLEVFHDDILNRDDYLVFKSDSEVKVASYSHTMSLIIVWFVTATAQSATKLVAYCPNIDKMG